MTKTILANIGNEITFQLVGGYWQHFGKIIKTKRELVRLRIDPPEAKKRYLWIHSSWLKNVRKRKKTTYL